MPSTKVLAIGAALVPDASTTQQALRNQQRLPFTHVSSFDAALNNKIGSPKTTNNNSSNVYIKRIAGSGPVQIILFSTGVVVTCSQDPSLHGHVVTFPPGTETILDIAAGESHYVASDARGTVYTWGWSNEFGQLGRGNIFAPKEELIGVHEPVALSQFGDQQRDVSPPSRIINTIIEQKIPHRIISVACGKHHTVLLTESRKCVFVFGRGHRGQLGLKDCCESINSSSSSSQKMVVDFAPFPRSVPSLFGLPIAQISASSSAHHTLVVLKSGHLIAMGENVSGNLGVPAHQSDDDATSRTTHLHCFLPTVVRVGEKSGNSSNSQHNSATGDAASLATSMIAFPQLPRRMTPLIPVDRKTSLPIHTPAVSVCFADTSSLHSVLIDTDGHLLTAGVPPLRLQNGEQPVAALGCLGRHLSAAADSSVFGIVPEFLVDVASGDSVVCGNGFTALLLRRQNAVLVAGAIQALPNKADVCVGDGIEAKGWLQLELPREGRVSQIFASGNGLLVVMRD